MKCDYCEMDEDEIQEHVLSFPGWRDELGDLDVLKMEDQVEFFVRVLKKKEG